MLLLLPRPASSNCVQSARLSLIQSQQEIQLQPTEDSQVQAPVLAQLQSVDQQDPSSPRQNSPLAEQQLTSSNSENSFPDKDSSNAVYSLRQLEDQSMATEATLEMRSISSPHHLHPFHLENQSNQSQTSNLPVVWETSLFVRNPSCCHILTTNYNYNKVPCQMMNLTKQPPVKSHYN